METAPDYTPSAERAYLETILTLLIERAQGSMHDQERAPDGSPERAHTEGRALAFFEVLDIMFHQAPVFGLRPTEIGFRDLVPDRDLLGSG